MGPTYLDCVTTVEKSASYVWQKSVVLVCTYGGRGEGVAVMAGDGLWEGYSSGGGQAGADSRFGYVHIQSRSMAPQH